MTIAIIGIILVVIIVAVFFILRSREKKTKEQDTGPPPPNRLDYHPEAQPRLAFPPTKRSAPLAQAVQGKEPKDVDLISTRKDLTESLGALSEKYDLDMFTIATADGLVFGSSGGDAAQSDAASFSELFRNNPSGEITGVHLFGLNHKGSDLIGIIRTAAPLSGSMVKQIEADTKAILNRWI